MSNPRLPTPTFPVSSPKLPACCAREAISCTPISAPDSSIAEWEAALAGAPMRMLSHEDINAQVLCGLEKNDAADTGSDRPHAESPAPHRPRVHRRGRHGVLPRNAKREVLVPDVLLHQRSRCELEFSLLRLDLEHGEHATDMSSVAAASASAIIVADEMRPDPLAPRLC